MKNYYLVRQFFTMIFCVSIGLNISGCADSNSKDQTVVYLKLEDMSYVADDSLNGNQKLDVPDITQSVMDNGGVLAFIERAAPDENTIGKPTTPY